MKPLRHHRSQYSNDAPARRPGAGERGSAYGVDKGERARATGGAARQSRCGDAADAYRRGNVEPDRRRGDADADIAACQEPLADSAIVGLATQQFGQKNWNPPASPADPTHIVGGFTSLAGQLLGNYIATLARSIASAACM